MIEVYNAPLPKKKSEEQDEPTRLSSIDMHGHRSDIRALSLSSDDDLLASISLRKFTNTLSLYLFT